MARSVANIVAAELGFLTSSLLLAPVLPLTFVCCMKHGWGPRLPFSFSPFLLLMLPNPGPLFYSRYTVLFLYLVGSLVTSSHGRFPSSFSAAEMFETDPLSFLCIDSPVPRGVKANVAKLCQVGSTPFRPPFCSLIDSGSSAFFLYNSVILCNSARGQPLSSDSPFSASQVLKEFVTILVLDRSYDPAWLRYSLFSFFFFYLSLTHALRVKAGSSFCTVSPLFSLLLGQRPDAIFFSSFPLRLF